MKINSLFQRDRKLSDITMMSPEATHDVPGRRQHGQAVRVLKL